ncbi:MAG TPA: response regulator [Candidatus Limnocylindria bacterium]|nr:response regulator [Candidatus Limnocylindria bacterium]
MAAPEPRLRAVIVDDEAPARALLREYLAAHADVEVVGECTNGFEAVKQIGELAPDIAFLDVQMPKLDGFEVLELIDSRPAVVFVTAYDEYALKAFEVHAVDYLLKPVGRERLDEALAHVRARRAAVPATKPAAGDLASFGPRPPSPAALAAAARPPGQFVERVLVKDGANVHVIPVERLDWIEAQDDYVAIHSGGKSYLKAQTLADVAAGLDPARFVRIHRSTVLNVERLARLELYAKDSRVAYLADGRELPVSRTGYARLRELLEGRSPGQSGS